MGTSLTVRLEMETSWTWSDLLTDRLDGAGDGVEFRPLLLHELHGDVAGLAGEVCR